MDTGLMDSRSQSMPRLIRRSQKPDLEHKLQHVRRKPKNKDVERLKNNVDFKTAFVARFGKHYFDVMMKKLNDGTALAESVTGNVNRFLLEQRKWRTQCTKILEINSQHASAMQLA